MAELIRQSEKFSLFGVKKNYNLRKPRVLSKYI